MIKIMYTCAHNNQYIKVIQFMKINVKMNPDNINESIHIYTLTSNYYIPKKGKV